MTRTLIAIAVLLVTAVESRGQNAFSADYNTPVGSNATVTSATPFAIATNVPTLVSRTICWDGTGILLVTETNTLPILSITTNSFLKGGTNYVTYWPPGRYTTNTLSGATNFVFFATNPIVRATTATYPLQDGQCYQSGQHNGLFKGMVLVSTSGGSGTAYLAEGRSQ